MSISHVKIRLYNPFDLDLIALYDAKGFSIRNAMKMAADYYAKGKRLQIEIPTLPYDAPVALTSADKNYSIPFNIDFEDDKYREALAMIMSVPSGYRNSFMKNILRSSLVVSPASYYFGTKEGSDRVRKLAKETKLYTCPLQKQSPHNPFLEMGENEVAVTTKDTDAHTKYDHFLIPSTPAQTDKKAEEELESLLDGIM